MKAGYGIVLRLLSFSFADAIELSDAEYREVLAAKRILLMALGAEEKLDILIENHAEFEQALLDLTLRYSLFLHRVELVSDGRNLLNRRIANYLTTARLYNDQLSVDFEATFGKDSPLLQELRSTRKVESGVSLGYRAMKALRNYAQHRGMPVHAISGPAEWGDGNDARRMRVRVIPLLDLAELAEDRKIPRSLLKELEPLADKQKLVNVVPLIRDCTAAFARVHEQVRRIIAQSVQKAEDLVLEIREKARDKFGEKELMALTVAERSEAGTWSNWVHLAPPIYEQRRELEAKNRHFGSLAQRYVSSEH